MAEVTRWRMIRAVLSWVMAAITLAASLQSQSDDVDTFIRAQMRAQNVPALSLAVVKDGQIVKAQGYGLADRQRNIAATPDTVYKIASVSKQFIAAGIMLLVQDGKLRVDDSIAKYLDGAPAAWTPLTVPLHEATRRDMWTPVTLHDGTTSPYGFGWQLGSFQGQRYVRHSGGMPGARAMFMRFPDARLTIIFLMNLDDADPLAIADGLAIRYLK